MNKIKTILYTRVSSEQQVDNTSLDQQEKIGREFCEKKGYELVKIFREEGESAKLIDRTKLKESLNFCANKKNDINCFIVYKYDRFSRSMENHVLIKAMLSKSGVKLLSITEPVDETPSGRLLENMLASIAQFDNEVRTERSVNGMRAKLEQGYWTFKLPTGYIRDKNNKDKSKQIIPHPQNFNYLREGWKMLLSGNYKLVEVERYLQERGVTTNSGKLIDLKALSKIFRNKFYTGLLYSDKFFINIKGIHKPMVSEVEFYQVQQILDKNFEVNDCKVEFNSDFPLAKTLYCSGCNRLLSGCFSKGKYKYYAYYQCGHRDCIKRQFLKKELVESKYIELLKKLAVLKEDLDIFKDIILDIYEKNFKDALEIQDHKKEKFIVIKKKIDKLKELLESDVYTKDEYLERKSKLEIDLVTTSVEVSESSIEVNELETCLNFITQFLEHPDKFWINLTDEGKVKLNKIIFPEGLSFENGNYRTPTLHPVYKGIGDFLSEDSNKLTSRRIELRFTD